MERRIRGRMTKYVKSRGRKRANGHRRRRSSGGLIAMIPNVFGLRRMVRKLA
jgi:hypothetical protein